MPIQDFRDDVFGRAAPVDDSEVRIELATACRALFMCGLDEGAAGHLTAKSVEKPGAFWVTPFGLDFGEVTADALVLSDHTGKVLEGEASVNTAAFLIHSAVHAARPDVGCVVHAHGLWGRTFAALGRGLRPITQNACAFYNDHAVLAEFDGPVLSLENTHTLVRALGQRKALVLQHHGLLTVANTVGAAAWWMIALERCCKSELLAEAAGGTHEIPPAVAALTAANVGTSRAAMTQYESLRRRAARSLGRDT